MSTCAFPECPRLPRSTKQPLCEGHYYQQRRGTELRPLRQFLPVPDGQRALPADRTRNTICGIDGCPKKARGRYCPMHRARIERHGDADAFTHQRDRALPRGEANPKWNPEPNYSTIHQRLRKLHGPAKNHVCSCGSRAAQWAYTGPREPGEREPFGTVDQYEAMCIPCHKRHDLAAIAVEQVAS